MITEYDIYGQLCPSTTSEELLYTVPTGKTFTSSTLTVCSAATIASGTEARYDVIARKSGVATTLAKHYLHRNVLVRPGEAHALTIGITAQAGAKIYVVSSVADTLAFNLFGTEISEVVS